MEECYRWQVLVTDEKKVRVNKFDPEGRELGSPMGWLGYTAEVAVRLDFLQERARTNLITSEEIIEFGAILFGVLFDQRLIRDFAVFLNRSGDAGVRIEIAIDEDALPDLAYRPWEFMRPAFSDEIGDLTISTHPKLLFSRRPRRREEATPIMLRPDEPLRIALIVAAPDDNDLGPIEYEPLWDAIIEFKNKHPSRVEVQLLTHANAGSLDKLLGVFKPHVFHFAGHARFLDDAPRKRGQIALVQRNTVAPDWRDGEQFAELFTRHSPRIVFLDACESGMGREAFSAIAARIVGQSIPAVIAMQYDVSNLKSIKFSLEFYRRVVTGEPIDRAVQEARRGIFLESSEQSRDFATPVLYLCASGGRELVLGSAPVPELQYGLIASKLLEGKLIPFLGATDYELAQYLAHEYGINSEELVGFYSYPDTEALDLACVSQFLTVTRDEGTVREALRYLFCQNTTLSPTHELIASLPKLLRERGKINATNRRFVAVTTNFDDALEQAFRSAGETRFHVVSYVAQEKENPLFWHWPPDRDPQPITVPNEYKELHTDDYPIILKLNGAVDPNDEGLDTFVVSEDHHIGYGGGDLGQLLPVILLDRLRNNGFLFLGYGLGNWNHRVILQRIWGTAALAAKSWAVRRSPSDLEERMWQQRKVEVLDNELDEFLARLRAKLLDGVPTTSVLGGKQ